MGTVSSLRTSAAQVANISLGYEMSAHAFSAESNKHLTLGCAT